MPYKTLAENRKARFDYVILETFEAGIELLGHEVKSVKAGRMGLVGSYAVVQGRELLLLNSQIPPYQRGNVPEHYDPARSRRLLLHKGEVRVLIGKLKQKSTVIVPLRTYLKGPFIKIELGLCKSKKAPDKREALKKKEVQREMRRGI
jgi:SsrA-binding protein